jgi:hypothetical protein
MTLRWLARELGKHDKRLAGFWPLQGNMLDYSGRGNHGMPVAGIYDSSLRMYSSDIQPMFFKRMKGYFFNSNSWINAGSVPDANFSGADQFAISFWMCLSTDRNNIGTIIYRGTPFWDTATGRASNVYGWEIAFDTGGTRLEFIWRNGWTFNNNAYIVTLPLQPYSNVTGKFITGWQHCVLVFDGPNVQPNTVGGVGITWYMNGKPLPLSIRQTTVYGLGSISDSLTQRLFIGNGTSKLFNVSVSSVRVYSTLLKAVEVQRIYNQEKDVFLPRIRVKRPPKTNTCTLFLKCIDVCNNKIPLYICGPKFVNNSGCPLYIRGSGPITKNCTLFIRNIANIANSGNPLPLYIRGGLITTHNLNLAINTPPASLYPTGVGVGQYPYSIFLPTHPVPTGFLPLPPPIGTSYTHSMNLVLKGDIVGRTTHSMNMSILGQRQAFAKGTTLYLSNTSSGTNNRIYLNITSTGTGPGVPGTSNTRTMNLFIKRWPSNVVNLFIAAPTPKSNNRPLFIMGTRSTAGSGTVGVITVVDTVSMRYWGDGLPLIGVRGKQDRGTMRYWADGIPGETMFKAPPVVPTITYPNTVNLSIPAVRGIYDNITQKKPANLFTSGF